MTNIKKNFLYNIVYQILIMILPFITAPYLARVIGADGTGLYSYTYSIANYFVLFAMLGINNYGNRRIAQVRDEKEKLSKEFWTIYTMQLVFSSIVSVIYIAYIIFFVRENQLLFILQIFYVISSCFDINWFFFGIEKFKLTVTRNTIIKLISVVSIILLVKKVEDLWIYAMIMALTMLASQLSIWPFLRQYVNFVRPSKKEVLKTIKPCIILFIPVIAVSIYRIMDKIMIGNLSTMEEVGYYEYADKIVGMPIALVNALGTVMLPKMSNLIAKGEKEKSKEYINKSMEFALFLAIPIVFGIIAIADDFVPIFLGEAFAKSATILKALSITIIFIIWANIIKTQYLIPNEKDRDYIVSVILGAIVNLAFNSILIPKYVAMGATIGTILAELSVAGYQTFAVRKQLPIKNYFQYFTKSFLLALVMLIIIFIIPALIPNRIIRMGLQVIVGIGVYAILNRNYILRNIGMIKK